MSTPLFTQLSLHKRLAIVLCVLLTGFGVLLGLIGFGAAKNHQQRTMQALNRDLAAHIASNIQFMDDAGLRPAAIEEMFSALMMVNPNIEAYLLDPDGRVAVYSPLDLELASDRVALEPIGAFLSGQEGPIFGDNPRNPAARQIFSVARLQDQGVTRGYLYIVLLGENYRRLLAGTWSADFPKGLIGLSLLAFATALLIGIGLFAQITRPLRRLTQAIDSFQNPDARSSQRRIHNEIRQLESAFDQLQQRLQDQMEELQRQDSVRRELVANISHDLRTPMTSMQGYLETLQGMDQDLSPEQRRYVDIAARQARRVGHMAQQLFELARLEREDAPPQPEDFSIAELLQDIAQKYALTLANAKLRLVQDCPADLPFVTADLGLIERAVSNLIDNAVRHTPEGGEITLAARPAGDGVEVTVADTGEGVDPDLVDGLFQRGSKIRQMASRRGGGLGLLITHRILELHGSSITAESKLGQGTTFRLWLPTAAAVRPGESGRVRHAD